MTNINIVYSPLRASNCGLYHAIRKPPVSTSKSIRIKSRASRESYFAGHHQRLVNHDLSDDSVNDFITNDYTWRFH